MRAIGPAEPEPETKSEARPIEVALAEAFKQPVRLVLSQFAGSDRLIDLRGELRISGGLDGGLHGLQGHTLLRGDGRQGLAALQVLPRDRLKSYRGHWRPHPVRFP